MEAFATGAGSCLDRWACGLLLKGTEMSDRAGPTSGGHRAMVDVLIPVFNGGATIRESVASIQGQNLSDIRIIVVDDGSTDDTRAILTEIATSDPRVQIITQKNSGIVDALNTGLKACTADLVARHDADDIAFPQRLTEQVAYLARRAECIAVASNAWHIDDNGRRTGKYTRFRGDVQPDADRAPSREPYLMHPFLMVRRSALAAAGEYRYAFHSEDTDLYWRLLAQGPLHNLEVIHGEYRVHSGSISSVSVVNGRISAVNSQLAALSYKRRLAGRSDLVFESHALEFYKEAESFERILTIAAQQLDQDEAIWLRIAAAAKLAELSAVRPYKLSEADYALIASAWQTEGSLLSMEHRSFLRAQLAKRLAGLIAQYRYKEARALGRGSGLVGATVFAQAKTVAKKILGK